MFHSVYSGDFKSHVWTIYINIASFFHWLAILSTPLNYAASLNHSFARKFLNMFLVAS